MENNLTRIVVFGPVTEQWGVLFNKVVYKHNDKLKGNLKEVEQQIITNSGVIFKRKIWNTTRILLELAPNTAQIWYCVVFRGVR